MTPILKPIASTFHTTNMILSLSLADLQESDARKCVRDGKGPSIAWSVGHMLHHRHQILGLLGVTKENPYAEKFSAAAAAKEDGDYPSVTDFLAQWKEVETDLDTAM